MRARSSYSSLTISHGSMMRSQLFIPYSRPQEHVSLSLTALTASHLTHLCQGKVQQHHILNIADLRGGSVLGSGRKILHAFIANKIAKISWVRFFNLNPMPANTAFHGVSPFWEDTVDANM